MPKEWCASNSPDYQGTQQDNIQDALRVLKKAGVLPSSLGFLRLESMAGELVLKYGIKSPAPTIHIFKLIGLSPGEINLWLHTESGWFTSAIARPGAKPVYKSVSEEIAITILKEELTHEFFEYLMTPDVNIDN